LNSPNKAVILSEALRRSIATAAPSLSSRPERSGAEGPALRLDPSPTPRDIPPSSLCHPESRCFFRVFCISSNKAVILSEAPRRSIANRGLYRAQSKDPGDACWRMLSRAFRPQTTTEDETPEPSLKKELQKVIIQSSGPQIFAQPFSKPHFPPGHQTKEIKDFAEREKDGSCPSRFPLWKIGRTHVQLWSNGTP
jgi:hypothetical protein